MSVGKYIAIGLVGTVIGASIIYFTTTMPYQYHIYNLEQENAELTKENKSLDSLCFGLITGKDDEALEAKKQNYIDSRIKECLNKIKNIADEYENESGHERFKETRKKLDELEEKLIEK